ncbi:response regulator [Synechococcales cyanobacterium C]|uniref:Response regulator n=1 Tax=Petrachloros mirabilis ULC683 TaxID=2781853 RepID=A0A8K2A7B7_9CYAN|nr:response regulator transcription factor [Petrachloros mirabilis]NCJ05810.1 response regulator [Petrachloros mirabilis ULC683]
MNAPLYPDLKGCVLLVQTDASLTQQITEDLATYDFAVCSASSRITALEEVVAVQPALIVIDADLGRDSGFRLCRELRRLGVRVPLLLLLSQERVQDRVDCLEAGADDYILKPYQGELFLQRVRLYLQCDPTLEANVLRFENLSLDLSVRSAARSGRLVDLTMKEFELLRYLMEHPREVLSREQILENVWGYDFLGESNVIEVYIRYLRLKLESEGEKRLIHTVRGVGYVLREA